MRAATRGFVLVVSLQPLDATTTLFFGQQLRLAPDAIRVVQYGRDDVAGPLGAASAVVLVRGLLEFGDVARAARALRIPLYYFLDDNFIVLRDQGGSEAAFVSQYSIDNVRRALREFAGVLLATPALVDYFVEQRLHPRLFLFPPVAGVDGLPVPPARWSGLHVAFFGGRHLHAMFLHTVVPAVRRLASERPVTLLTTGVAEPLQPSNGLSVVQQPYDQSYARGIARLTAEGVDLLVHPTAPGLATNPFKNPHALISANALGAVPIVSNSPPYDGLGPDEVALRCDNSEESWYRALARATADESLRSAVREHLARYCADRFGGTRNREVLETILGEHAPPAGGRILRSGIARGCLLMSLASRAGSRVGRRMGLKAVAAA